MLTLEGDPPDLSQAMVVSEKGLSRFDNILGAEINKGTDFPKKQKNGTSSFKTPKAAAANVVQPRRDQ